MSTTSSRTPGIDENSCNTPSMWIEVIAAPCREDKQNAAQRVAEGLAEAALERLGDDRRGAARVFAQSDFELLRLDEFLPVLLNHGEAFHWTDARLRARLGAREVRKGAPASVGAHKFIRGAVFADGSRCAEWASRRGSR